jgi:hypothetical protein
MRRSIIIQFFIAAGTLLLFACEKGIPTYSGTSAVYFNNTSDSSKITFAYDFADKKDTTISIRVYTMGAVSDVDRTFSLNIIDTLTSAKKDNDYKLLNDPVIIKAGQASTDLKFKLFRRPDMTTKTYVISMMLQPDDNFTTDYSWEWVNLSKKTVRQLVAYTITFDDIFARPKVWLDSYHGTYSRTKMYAMTNFFGLQLIQWTLTSGTGAIGATTWITFTRVFQRYLNEERARGNEIMDEDGKPMSMGALSQS